MGPCCCSDSPSPPPGTDPTAAEAPGAGPSGPCPGPPRSSPEVLGTIANSNAKARPTRGALNAGTGRRREVK
eukprot:8136019-Alexandrium_andersonii.AAC.1